MVVPACKPTWSPTFTDGTSGCVPARHMRHVCAAVCCPEPTWSVCVGRYAFGAVGSNECPANFLRVQAEGACRTAAAAAGQAYKGSETDAGYPRGCYSTTLDDGSSGVFFNLATTGAGQSASKLLCAAPTASPTPTPTNAGDTNPPTLPPGVCSNDYVACSSAGNGYT